jgi:hypothetical protein
MKKIILLSVALASFLVATDHNQTRPLTKEEEFNREVLKRVDNGLSEMKRKLAEIENMKASGGGASLDATALPMMQGSYSISKGGKPLVNEVFVQDSGGGEMYLNKHNNIITASMNEDYTTYKVGSTTVKTPIVYNNNAAPKLTKAITPAINTVSQTTNSNSLNLLPPPALPKTIKKEDF